MTNFGSDLRRVTYDYYITGKAAINFPSLHTTTGGWHYLAYWNSMTGQAKVSLAGIHYPETTQYFGATGIVNASEELQRRGWIITHEVFMADHFRATGDMVLEWAKSRSNHCNVELHEWFPNAGDMAEMIDLLKMAFGKLDEIGRARLDRWLESQLR